MRNPADLRSVAAALALAAVSVVGLPAQAVTVVVGSSADATLLEDEMGALANGAGEWFFAGNTNTAFLRRGVIVFDLRGIPAGSTVTGATLSLNMSRTQAGTQSVRLHRLTRSWSEGPSNPAGQEGGGSVPTTGDATWLHAVYPTVLWTTPGGDFVAAPSATTSVGGIATYTWTGAGVVADVQGWVNDPAVNRGWIVIGGEAGTQTTKRFGSRTEPNAANRPQLTVVYTAPAVSGACCTGGSCLPASPAACASLGGAYVGNGTTCSPDPCGPFVGGCCAATGGCALNSANGCAASGGSYEGDGTTCSPNPCPQPIGACCADDASCTPETQGDCTAAGGDYRGDNTLCAELSCPVVLEPFVDALPIPPVAQPTSGVPGGAAEYELAMTQFTQQLHRDLPPTTLWGYGGSYPGPTIEATSGAPVSVTWINDLRDEQGQLRTTHYLPMDLCLHGPDMGGDAPRTVVHLHGAHVPPESDGHPEDTQLPGQADVYTYPNDQLPATLWYHDHALGITRLNVYMGLAGFYLLRDAYENFLGLPAGPYEIPLLIQDRTFNPDGTLSYPASWEDHFFGDKILVNGKVWPYLNVHQGKYRFRLLNGSGSRTYTLSLSNGATFHQLGTEGGLLLEPAAITQLTLQPAERADVIFNFAGYPPGTEIVLTNSAPSHFPGTPGVGVVPNVMKFVVTGSPGYTTALPALLRPVERLQEASAALSRDFELRLLPDPCTGSVWSINGRHWNDIDEYPELGTTEIWRFINISNVSHPMHMHLVMFQVLDRQDFEVNGNQVVPVGPRIPPPLTENGWKDTVQAHPFQITRVIARFTDYTGLYAYHCHILEHEDHDMMRQFRAVQCGNEVVEPSESCDHGNRIGGDGCSSGCDTEWTVRLVGSASGGTVTLVIEGQTVQVATSAGQSAAQVAAALAAAINANVTLQMLGVTATTRGSTLITIGALTSIARSDAGLDAVLWLTVGRKHLHWSSVEGATTYDVVRGSLATLRSSSGNFAAATQACLADETATTSLAATTLPPPGQASWYLVRERTDSGVGTYDSGGAHQVGSRDAEIAASGFGCP